MALISKIQALALAMALALALALRFWLHHCPLEQRLMRCVECKGMRWWWSAGISRYQDVRRSRSWSSSWQTCLNDNPSTESTSIRWSKTPSTLSVHSPAKNAEQLMNLNVRANPEFCISVWEKNSRQSREESLKPGTHWRQSWIQHGRLCWKSTVAERVALASYTLATTLKGRSTFGQQSWPYRQQCWNFMNINEHRLVKVNLLTAYFVTS